jgi:hypothetical protein
LSHDHFADRRPNNSPRSKVSYVARLSEDIDLK